MTLASLNRWKASGPHLCLSALIALTVVTVMLALWYPGPYFGVMGGQTLLMLIVGVDVTLGPLLTLIVFDLKRKPLRALKRDLAVIGVFQLAALAYGVWVTFEARPVLTAFVKDRFEVVAANELDAGELAAGPAEYRRLSLTGPRIIGVRLPTDPKERSDLAFSGLAGHDAQQIPKYYVAYPDIAPDVIRTAKPIAALTKRYPQAAPDIQAIVARSDAKESNLGYVPLRARENFESAVVDLRDGRLLSILPFDPY